MGPRRMPCNCCAATGLIAYYMETSSEMLAFQRWNFQMHFLWRKILYLNSYFTEVVPKDQINNNAASVEVVAGRWRGDKSLSEAIVI